MNERYVTIPVNEYKSLVKAESDKEAMVRFIKIKGKGSCMLREDIEFLLELIGTESEEEF